MNTRIKIAFIAIVATVIVLEVFYSRSVQAPQEPLASVTYRCNEGKSIDAVYYKGDAKPAATADLAPVPSGSVDILLSDGRSMTLPQTLSADGGRYANADESFIFWSKGNGALVLENNEEKSYIGCILVAPVPEGSDLTEAYVNNGDGYSIRYPEGYAIDESYRYQSMGPNKDIAGTKLSISAALAQGTNLSSDTYLSVETIPQTRECDAKLFLDQASGSSTVVDREVTYSVASSTGAAAGNRYEETVYALPGTNPCIAVRYFVHYGVIENYPAGAVREFDADALLAGFDAMRRTLIIR